ncbi:MULTISPECIES: FkbM family methyltransferase [unclassified Caballeronia]|uniref:FkbM family methyltransferase n=1 Tax=unclassified Caballeronia TaxID=2646786 RepID=UPI002028F284
MNRTLRVSGQYILVRARHGLMLANPSDFFIGHALIKYGEYCEIEAEILRQLFSRPGAIVEVGANIGSHTVALAKQAALQQRDMIAFEPQPFIFQNLCANLALNGVSNVRAWPWACGNQDGTLYFSTPDYSLPGNFGGVSMHAVPQSHDTPISCVRLDDVLENYTVGFIKIDVEGAELSTLQGSVQILKTSRPVLYLENDRIEKSQALIEWLWGQNYRLWWHLPPLFNPNNFFGVAENIYADYTSCNMLALPAEFESHVEGLEEIVDATFHPCAPSQSKFS